MSDLAQHFGQHRWLVVGVAGATVSAPPLGFFGAAALGVWTLRHGQFDALISLLFAALVAGIISVVTGGGFAGGVLVAAITLVPVVLLALSLRWRQSLNLTVQLAVLVGLLAVVLVSALLPDHAEFWRGALERWLAQGGEQAISESERQRLMEAVPFALLTGAAVANWLLVSLGALFLARSWQARVVNPGGFRREFHQLRLGRTLGLAAIAVSLLAALLPAAMLSNLAIVLLAGWLLQGLAVAHYAAAVRGWTMAWMVTFYVVLGLCLLMASPVLVLVSLVGLADQFFNFRQRLTRPDDDAGSRPGSGQE